jgi:hypothetical protein
MIRFLDSQNEVVCLEDYLKTGNFWIARKNA